MFSWVKHWFWPHKGNNYRAHALRPHGLALIIGLSFLGHTLIASLYGLPLWPHVLGDHNDITVTEIFQQTNAVRAGKNLASLSLNPVLNRAAQEKAADMVAQGYWSHTTPSGKQPWDFIRNTGYSYSVAGENLARNFSSTKIMMASWLASPTHRENLLSNLYTETGIAVVPLKHDDRTSLLVVQLFADPQSNSDQNQVITISNNQLPITTNNNQPQILGFRSLAGAVSPLELYRLGAAFIVGFLIILLLVDYQQQHKQKSRKHGKQLAHILLLMIVLFIVALAEGGSLL